MDSWLKRAVHFRDPQISSDHTWFINYRPVVELLLQENHCKVAAYDEMPHQIFGYIVYNPSKPIVHWLFVKKIMQKMGIANKLLDASIGLKTDFIATHYTDEISKLYSKRKITYNPLLLMRIERWN